MGGTQNFRERWIFDFWKVRDKNRDLTNLNLQKEHLNDCNLRSFNYQQLSPIVWYFCIFGNDYWRSEVLSKKDEVREKKRRARCVKQDEMGAVKRRSRTLSLGIFRGVRLGAAAVGFVRRIFVVEVLRSFLAGFQEAPDAVVLFCVDKMDIGSAYSVATWLQIRTWKLTTIDAHLKADLPILWASPSRRVSGHWGRRNLPVLSPTKTSPSLSTHPCQRSTNTELLRICTKRSRTNLESIRTMDTFLNFN
jgi:hypothetical protein